MPRGVPEVTDTWRVEITEGNKKYSLTLKLFKSRLNIEDEEGNKIAVDKRNDCIKIERWGNVDWPREKNDACLHEVNRGLITWSK